MSRRQETRRRRERRMVARRREGGKEGVGVFSCSRRIARQHRLSRSCRRACNGELTGFHIYFTKYKSNPKIFHISNL